MIAPKLLSYTSVNFPTKAKMNLYIKLLEQRDIDKKIMKNLSFKKFFAKYKKKFDNNGDIAKRGSINYLIVNQALDNFENRSTQKSKTSEYRRQS